METFNNNCIIDYYQCRTVPLSEVIDLKMSEIMVKTGMVSSYSDFRRKLKEKSIRIGFIEIGGDPTPLKSCDILINDEPIYGNGGIIRLGKRILIVDYGL